MKVSALLAAVSVSTLLQVSAFAEGPVYHWKGTEVVYDWPISQYEKVAACAFWTNAANWVEGVVPGQYVDPDGNTVGDPDATVVFSELPDGGQPIVNIQGLYTVANVTFDSKAPSYQIGTTLDSGKEVFRPYSTRGRIVIESGAAAQKFRILACCSDRLNTGAEWNADPQYPMLVNESENAVTIERFGMCGYPGATWGAGEFPFGFGGGGEILVKGMGTRYHTMRFMMHQSEGGKLTFDCDVGSTSSEFWARLIASKGDGVTRELSITANHTFVMGSPYGGFEVDGRGSTLKVTGEGTFKMYYAKKQHTASYINTPHAISGGARLLLACNLAGLNTDSGLHVYSGGGTVEITGESSMTGLTDLLSSESPTVSVASIGSEATGGPLGNGSIRLVNSGRILYTGAGETCSRAIILHDHRYGIYNATTDPTATPAGVIEQGGTGPLVVNSAVTVDGTATGTLKLANSTDQDATWAAALVDSAAAALAVVKTGTGKWTLSGANTYTGATTIQGGTLEIADAAALGGTSGIKVDTAAATLKVADGVAVPATALSQSGSGKLDVVLGTGSSFKTSGLAEGSAPAWLTIGGAPAKVAADGTLLPNLTRWAAAVDGTWNDAGKWDNGVPTDGMRVDIDKPGEYTVSIPEAAANPFGVLNQKYGTIAMSAPVTITAGVDIGPDATFTMTDGTLGLVSATAKTGEFHLDGGSASFSGGTVNITNFYAFTGGGTLAFSGTAKVLTKSGENNDVRFTADAGSTLNVSFTDSAYLYAGNASGFLRLGGVAGGRTMMTITRVNNFADTTANVGMGMTIADGNGYAELLCNHNYGYIGAGNAGVIIGAGSNAAELSAPTGVLKIAGNTFSAGGVGFWWQSFWGGLSVGNGLRVRDGYGSRAVGRIELDYSRGNLGVSGTCGIGIGRGEGEIVQLNGTFSYNGGSSWNGNPTRYHPMVIGYAGGDGAFVISNGTASVNNGAIYVGGCLASDLGRYTSLDTSCVQSGKKDSVGFLAARGGSFTQKYASGVIVGADGTGRLEIGPAGSFTTTSLVISNACSGTLAFELGAEGQAGALTAADLTVADGAKLVIDARGAQKVAKWTKLATLGNAPTGAFAADDIEILATGAIAEKLAEATIETEKDGEPGLWLKRTGKGLLFIVR